MGMPGGSHPRVGAMGSDGLASGTLPGKSGGDAWFQYARRSGVPPYS